MGISGEIINPADLDIYKLIPQRVPMMMIDKLVSCSETNCETIFTIREDNIFVRDGLMREPGIIENIAQSAAAKIGFKSFSENIPAPVGFIGSIDNLKIYSNPSTGDVLRTTIHVSYEIMSASIVEGHTFIGDDLIAECTMKIFIQN